MLNPDKVKLAIAPIGWTNDDMPDLGAENTFEQCISEMALAGFSGSEIGNKYPSDPAVLKPYLDIRGLQICNAWFSSYLTSKPYEETIAAFKQHCDKLHALGAKVIGASEQGNSIQGCLDKSILDEKPVYTEAQWQTVARGLTRWRLRPLQGHVLYRASPHGYRRADGGGDRPLDGIDGSGTGVPAV